MSTDNDQVDLLNPDPSKEPPKEPPAEPPAEPSKKAKEPPKEPAKEPPKEPPAPKWPDDWRQQLAGDDEKALKQLQRYSTPADVWRKARSLEQKLSSGEYRMALSEEPSEEELAEFRKANGIPEKPEDYDLSFEDGLVIGDEDKPVIDGFVKHAHETHQTPDQVKSTIQWYYNELERQADERDEQDKQAQEKAEDALRAEWGNNYRREMTMTKNLLSQLPGDLPDKLLSGRLADGTPIGSSPEFLLWANNLARELNPMGTLTGAEGADAMKGIDARISEIKDIMRKDRPRYNRENLGEELAELHRKKEAMKGRAA